MNAECSQSPSGRLNRADLFRHANIPELDLAITASTNQFTHTTALHVYISDPLLVAAVALYHRGLRFLSLIKD